MLKLYMGLLLLLAPVQDILQNQTDNTYTDMADETMIYYAN